MQCNVRSISLSACQFTMQLDCHTLSQASLTNGQSIERATTGNGFQQRARYLRTAHSGRSNEQSQNGTRRPPQMPQKHLYRVYDRNKEVWCATCAKTKHVTAPSWNRHLILCRKASSPDQHLDTQQKALRAIPDPHHEIQYHEKSGERGPGVPCRLRGCISQRQVRRLPMHVLRPRGPLRSSCQSCASAPEVLIRRTYMFAAWPQPSDPLCSPISNGPRVVERTLPCFRSGRRNCPL